MSKVRWSEFVNEYGNLDEVKNIFVLEQQAIENYDIKINKKLNLKSLLTNKSYAVDVDGIKTYYPVKGSKRDAERETETLQRTIKYEENIDDLTDESKVKLYEVDLDLLPSISGVKRNYVINIVNGNLYSIDKVEYEGLIYHTPRYGVRKEESKLPEESDETSLIIHYECGYIGEEKSYEQKVPISQASAVTLDKNKFKRGGMEFFRWKDVTEEKANSGADVDPVDEDGETNTENEFVKRTDGYFGVVNKLRNPLGEEWEQTVIEIIDDVHREYLGGYIEQEEWDERVQQTREVTINNIIFYLMESNEIESEINTILSNSGIANASINALAIWMVSDTDGVENKDYLEQLQQYEANHIEDEENEDSTDPDTNEDEGVYYDDQETNVDMQGKEMWLRAEWVENESDIVTVTYDAGSNGEIEGKIKGTTSRIKTEKKVKSTKLETLPIVVVEGVKFTGQWYDALVGGNKVTKDTVVNEDITLYCRWSKVELHNNGGECKLYPIDDTAKREDYQSEFQEWNPKKYNAIFVADGEVIGSQTEHLKYSYPQLPVGYQKENYKRRIERNVRKPNVLDIGEKEIGDYLLGWNTAADLTGKKLSYNSIWKNEYGTDLYAMWQEKYGVIYDANGGAWSRKRQAYRKVTVNTRYPTISKPKKDGCSFVGWYDAPDGGNKIELGNSDFLVDGDITLYAHWVEIEFEVEIGQNTITKTGWTQNIKNITGSVSNYNVKYYISENSPTDKNAQNQNSNSVSGKSENSVYYVWATASKGDITLKSKNYIIITTAYSHKETVLWWENTGSFDTWVEFKGSYYCNACAASVSSGGWKSVQLPLMNHQCLECNAYIKYQHRSRKGVLCNNCYQNREEYTVLDSDGNKVKVEAVKTKEGYVYDTDNKATSSSINVTHRGKVKSMFF